MPTALRHVAHHRDEEDTHTDTHTEEGRGHSEEDKLHGPSHTHHKAHTHHSALSRYQRKLVVAMLVVLFLYALLLAAADVDSSQLERLKERGSRLLASKSKADHSVAHERLWSKINGPWNHWPGMGFCRNGVSLLQDIPNDVCQRRVCIHSPHVNASIDLNALMSVRVDERASQDTLRRVQWLDNPSACREAKGGQLPVKKTEGKSRKVQVSFLYTIHNNADLAAASILEVFRTANEAESVEFIVVDDGSTEDLQRVVALLNNLERVFGVRVVWKRHEKAQGYLLSNNEGMSLCSGEYVVLLNSDVLVLPGWLSTMLHTMMSHSRAGMVGSLALNVDGRVQEAGGMLFRHGQPFNAFRSLAPHKLSVHHTRVVDYISAACLCVRRKLFLSLSLFDTHFTPAYYEDTDAAVVHAKAGFDTILQPFSVVLHFEGKSYGTSGSSVKDSLMEANGAKFHEKHAKWLDAHCPAPDHTVVAHNDRSVLTPTLTSLWAHTTPTHNTFDVHSGMTFYRGRNRILVLDDIVPEPDRDAGSIRLLAILQIMRELGFSVTFESQPILGRSVRYLLQLFYEGVHVIPPGTLQTLAREARSPLHKYLASSQHLCPWDAVFVARRDVFTRHREALDVLCPHAQIPLIFDTVDVHFVRETRMFLADFSAVLNTSSQTSTPNNAIAQAFAAEALVSQVKALRNENVAKTHSFSRSSLLRRSSFSFHNALAEQRELLREWEAVCERRARELESMVRANVTLVVSSEEERVLRNIFQDPLSHNITIPNYSPRDRNVDVRVVSNIYEVEDEEVAALSDDFEGREGAIFVGNMCHTPNVDAVEFILKEVLVGQASLLPERFVMHFVWSRTAVCAHAVLSEAEKHPRVRVWRDVSDAQLLELHKSVKAVFAPLRYGAGVKGKVNYGLLHGVPVIASAIACEGMGLSHEQNVLVAQSGSDFALALRRLYEEKELFRKIARGGRSVMREHFSREVAKTRLAAIADDLHIRPQTTAITPFTCPRLDAHDSQKHLFPSYWLTYKGEIETTSSSGALSGGGKKNKKKKNKSKHKQEKEKIVANFPLYPRSAWPEDYLTFVN